MVLLLAPNVSMVKSSSIFRLAVRFPRFRWSCLTYLRYYQDTLACCLPWYYFLFTRNLQSVYVFYPYLKHNTLLTSYNNLRLHASARNNLSYIYNLLCFSAV